LTAAGFQHNVIAHLPALPEQLFRAAREVSTTREQDEGDLSLLQLGEFTQEAVGRVREQKPFDKRSLSD